MKLGCSLRFATRSGSVLALALLGMVSHAFAQNGPQVLPYTIQKVVGGGIVCATAADTFGDGCPATQATLNNALLGIAADARGNLYITDSTNNLIRRVDAVSGIVTVAAGSTKTTICAAALDAYGDGCPASDGLANAAGGYTSLDKPNAIVVAKNGDVYFTGTASLVQKISATTGIMSLVAGVTTPTGNKGKFVSGYTGDNGPATSAELNLPRGLDVDAYNDVYIADSTNNVVRVVYEGGPVAAAQITAAYPSVTSPVVGYIYTICGSTAGTADVTGDGGPAAKALLDAPTDVRVDQYGNVFILDNIAVGNSAGVVRMIYAGGNVMGVQSPVVGNIYRIAGGGSVKGTSTQSPILGTTFGAFSVSRKLALDTKGNLFITDSNGVIWFMDAQTGWIRMIAGVFKGSTFPTGCAQQTDTYGDNCPAILATLALPSGVAGFGITLDANENLYITDANLLAVRKVFSNLLFPATTPALPVTQTVELHYAAGTSPATTPFLFANSDYAAGTPTCVVNGDTTQDCTVAITFTPSVPGVDRGMLTTNITPTNTGSIGFTGIGVVPALSIDPGAATVAGSGMSQPQGIVKDSVGNLLIADTANNRVLRYNIASQTQTVIAGTGTANYTGDGGAATAATLRGPKAVAIAADGSIYIADTGNNVIRRIDPVAGTISTIAGGASTVCAGATDALGDGCPGLQAIFSAPAGLTVDANGLLYVSDTGNNRVRIVPVNSYDVVTIVGGGTACTAATDAVGDGCNALQATLSGPTQMRFDVSGNLYIADTGNNRVRRVNFAASGQTIVSAAGNGGASGSGDGGLATSAQLDAPSGIAIDGSGSLYIADTKNHAVRMVDVTSGVISTIAGQNGTSGAGTLPGAATSTLLNQPASVEIFGSGTLFTLDTGNNRALAINRDTLNYNFGKVNIGQSNSQPFTLTSTGASTAALGSPLTTATGTTSQFTFVPATTNGCSNSEQLSSGQQCVMTGKFTPTLNGNQSATYTFTGSTGINSPTPSVTLLGGGNPVVATSSVAVLTTPATGNPQYGQTTVVTDTITPASPGATSISGSVVFQIDTNPLQAPIAVTPTGNANDSGTAAFTLPANLSVGTHTIYATYSGDLNYGSSAASPLTVVVVQTATTTTVSATPTSSIQFQSVTFTANVTSTTGAVPAGTVNFLNGATTLGTGTLNAQGVATFTSATLAVGTYQIVAQYVGSGNSAGSSSSTLTFVVSPDPPGVTLTGPSSVSVAQGGNAQATFTMTPTNTTAGSVTLSCSGMPANTYCTFQPQVTNFTLTTDQPVSVLVTFWTNISPGTIPGQASLHIQNQHLWLALLAPFGLLLLRRRRRVVRLLVFGFLLLGIPAAFTGCSSNAPQAVVTPAGVSTVTVQASGPNGLVSTLPIKLTVVANP